MSATKAIRDAIVTAAGTILVANGYSTEVVEVSSEPKGIDEVRAPAIYLISMEGNSEVESLSNLQGRARQTYRAQLTIQSSTPGADMDAFLDDLRNAIEKESISNIPLGLNYVEKITVTGWSPTFTESHIHEGLYLRECDVVVDYVYTRGSV
jgi:hypothetical protein